MDYYYQEESEYWKQPCNFEMKGCKYNSEKLAKKPGVSPCKEPMEGFEYSSLFSSKTYSILSYIVGGFVGSKSQMNNNKHNFSYDLSAAVFNLLNSCKLEKEKSLVRKSNENNYALSRIQTNCYEKYIVNKSSQKCEKITECLVGVMEMGWFSALPLEEFIDQENYVLDLSEQYDGLINKNPDKNFSKFSNCDENKELDKVHNEICCDKTENLMRDTPEKEHKEQLKDHTPVDNISTGMVQNLEIMTKPENTNDVCNNKINLFLNDHNEKPKGVTVTDSGCLNTLQDLPPYVINHLATMRFRQQSECSIDSTDSESFIVFDDQEEERKGGKDCYSVGTEDYDTEDDDYEYEESSCDEYDFNSVDIDIAEANKKWLENYQKVTLEENEPQRKVRFNDNIQVNKIIAWDYAYRAARVGPWEQMLRDRVRFQERIQRLSLTISPVLEKEHRDKIYKKLCS